MDLLRATIRQVLREFLLPTAVKRGADDSLLTNITKQMSSGFSPEIIAELQAKIDSILENGINETMVFPMSKKSDYVTTVLATLYNSNLISKQQNDNIRNYFFIFFNPFSHNGEASPAARYLAQSTKTLPGIYNKNVANFEVFMDMISKAIYPAIDYTLNKYNGQVPYSRYFFLKARGLFIDKLQSYYTKHTPQQPETDEEKYGATGLSHPRTLSAEYTSNIQKVYDSINEFAIKKLTDAGPKYKSHLQLYMALSKGKSTKSVANSLKMTPNNLRTMRSRMNGFLSQFVDSGELQKYIKEKTGMKTKLPVHRFIIPNPNIQINKAAA